MLGLGLVLALVIGLLLGLLGGGGSILTVPALVYVLGYGTKSAIAMNASSGFIGYLGAVTIDWQFLTGFTAVAIAARWLAPR